MQDVQDDPQFLQATQGIASEEPSGRSFGDSVSDSGQDKPGC